MNARQALKDRRSSNDGRARHRTLMPRLAIAARAAPTPLAALADQELRTASPPIPILAWGGPPQTGPSFYLSTVSPYA